MRKSQFFTFTAQLEVYLVLSFVQDPVPLQSLSWLVDGDSQKLLTKCNNNKLFDIN